MIRVVVPGQPTAKGRPKFAVIKGHAHAFTPARTVAYEGLVARAGHDAMGDKPLLDGPVAITVFAHFQMPKSWSQRRRAAALIAPEWHTARPDADNILKVVDGLNGIIWRDDSQIASAQIVKVYAEKPQLVIEVRSL